MPADTAPLIEQWTVVDGLPMLFRVATDAAPLGTSPIVHVDDFGVSGRFIALIAERLAPYYPTYVPDLPGYGRSNKLMRLFPLSIPDLAQRLATFMDAVKVEGAVLLGKSMGSQIALEFAHAYPDRIDRAIMVSPAGGPPNQSLYRGQSQIVSDGVRESSRLLPVAVPDYLRFGPRSLLRVPKEMARYPTAKWALGLDLPMLVVAGARDRPDCRERLREIVKEKPNLTLVIHARASHAINFSHPQALASVVRAWLDDQPMSSKELRRRRLSSSTGRASPRMTSTPYLLLLRHSIRQARYRHHGSTAVVPHFHSH